MTYNRTRQQLFGTWVVVGGLMLAAGAFSAGCGGGGSSTPMPTPPQDTPTQEAPVQPPPQVTETQEPTAADVAAARPKKVVDPFTLPANKGLTPGQVANANASPSPGATGPNGKTRIGKNGKGEGGPAKGPTPPPPPPTPPAFQAVGIFGGSHGPVAILAPGAGKGGGAPGQSAPGTIIVTTGTKLDEGGYVKSIDPVSRKVVIEKEKTDFVLPLEAPAGPPGSASSPSATGK